MGWIRNFTNQEDHNPTIRNIDSDAPHEMRRELVDLFFSILDNNPDILGTIDHDFIYRVSCQSMGFETTANPYGGPRTRVEREILRANWQQVYNLICRLWQEYRRVELADQYRNGVNRILSAHGIVWDLDDDGRLQRVLPPAAQTRVEATIHELSRPGFEAALELFTAARDAYDSVPRRERDACANAFDALESVAKTVFEMPNKTFGDVLKEAKTNSTFNDMILLVLEKLYALANDTFRHGDIEKFNLSSEEVDFVYLTCVAGILLFGRMPE